MKASITGLTVDLDIRWGKHGPSSPILNDWQAN
jgi:hypothetical protein